MKLQSTIGGITWVKVNGQGRALALRAPIFELLATLDRTKHNINIRLSRWPRRPIRF